MSQWLAPPLGSLEVDSTHIADGQLTPAKTAGTAVVTADARLSDARTPLSHDNTKHSVAYATESALTTHTGAAAPHSGHETPSGAQAKVDAHKDVTTGVHGVGASTLESVVGSQAKVDTHAAVAAPHSGHAATVHTHIAGDITGTAVLTADSRLSDARTPTAHAGTHVTGGTDVIANAVAAGNAGLMTGADKSKLDGIAAGAEVNVNADWDAGSGDAQILNKPTLDEITPPAASVNFNGQQATAFRIENRTSDPVSPTVGQVWLRTDL